MIIESFAQDPASVTLAAATETSLMGGASGIDITGAEYVCIVLKNTGGNTITAIDALVSPNGTNFVTMGLSLGTIAASALKLIRLTPADIGSAKRLKVTATSTSGSTVDVEVRAARSHTG